MKRILSGAAGLALIVFTIGFVASAARADTITRPVGDAGSVTFTTDGGVLALVGAEAAEGWTYTIDRQDGSHLKLTFRDATGAEVEFEAEIEDGNLAFGDSDQPGSTTTLPGDGSTTSTTLDDDRADDDSTTSTTLGDSDDDSDDDSDNASDDDSDDVSDDDDSDDASDADDSDDDADDHSGPGSGDTPVAPEPATYVVGAAGTVSVLFADGEVSLTGVTTTDGWTYEVDHMGGSHVEIEFDGPDGAGFDFRVDADGSIEID